MQLLNNRLRSNTILPPLCRACRRPTPRRHSIGNTSIFQGRTPGAGGAPSWCLGTHLHPARTTAPGGAPRPAPACGAQLAARSRPAAPDGRRHLSGGHPRRGIVRVPIVLAVLRSIEHVRYPSRRVSLRQSGGRRALALQSGARKGGHNLSEAGTTSPPTSTAFETRGAIREPASPAGGRKPTRPPNSTSASLLLFRCTALLIVAVASARQGRCALLTRRLPTAGAVRMLERAPAGRFNSQPTYVYAYARHSVADCPQGQLCDPAPPRSCGAPRGIAQGDVHAAPALHATLFRARRVALSVPAVLELPAFALFRTCIRRQGRRDTAAARRRE
jgi:hypothetical protein